MDLAWRNSVHAIAPNSAPTRGQLAPRNSPRILRGSRGLRRATPLRAQATTAARRDVPTPRTGHATARAEAGSAAAEAKTEADARSGGWREAERVGAEIKACCAVVARMGRGFVYLGSSRVKEEHPFFQQSMALSRQIALEYGSTTWSGIGPGLMDAVALGAEAVNSPVAGFKILSEARQAEATFVHPRLPAHAYVTCCSVLARKQGFLMAGSRGSTADTAGFIALPGGVGTLDEILDLLALRQLGLGAGAPGEGSLAGSTFGGVLPQGEQGAGLQAGSPQGVRGGVQEWLPVPFLLMDYGGCYQSLLACMAEMERWGLVDEGEVEGLWHVCRSNDEALNVLRRFYASRG